MDKQKKQTRASVSIHGYEYVVKIAGGSVERVTKERVCSCGLANCIHVQAVTKYLKSGGMRAPSPPTPVVCCPICGGKIFPDRNWSDRDEAGRRTPGWRCAKGGLLHFLQNKAGRVKKRLAEAPWLFPPVYDESGACVYPGVRRDEILTFDQCAEINQRIYLETGYDPAA